MAKRKAKKDAGPRDVLIDLLPQAVLVVDQQGIIRLANPVAAQLLGQAGAALEGSPFNPPIPDGQKVDIEIPREGQPPFVCSAHSTSIDWQGENARLILITDSELHDRSRQGLDEGGRPFATLTSNLPGIIYRCVNDRKRSMEYISEGCQALTGYTRDELIGNSRPGYNDLIHIDDRQMVWNTVQEAVSKHRPYQITYRLQTKYLEEKWVWEQGQAVDSPKGNPQVLEGLILDITPHKLIEQQFHQRHGFLQRIMDTAPVGIYIYDSQQYINLYANQHISDILGYPLEEIRREGMGFFARRIHPQHLEKIHNLQERIKQLGEHDVFQEEYSLQHPDGRWIWLQAFESVLERDEHGKAIKVLGILQDVTERRETEEELRQSESKIQSIFQAAPGGIGVVVNRVLTEVNDYICELLGYRRDELIGSSSRIFYPDEDEFKRVGDVKYKQIRRTGKGTVETRWQCKDGRILDVLLSSVALDPADLTRGVAFTALDISELKKSEQDLQESRQFLQSVLDHVPQAIFWKDKELRFLGGNREFARDAGVDHPDELKGRDDYQMPWHEWAERYRADDRQVIDTGIPKLGYEEPQTTPFADQIWLRTSKVPLQNYEGQIVGVLGMYEDITAGKLVETQAQQRLMELEATNRLSQILRAADNPQDILALLLEQALAALHTDCGSIWLYAQETGKLERILSRGWVDSIDWEPTPPGEGLVGTVYSSGIPHVMEDLKTDKLIRTQSKEKLPENHAGASVPIQASGSVIGVLFLSVEQPRQLAHHDIELLVTLAEMAGNAIQRMRLFHRTAAHLERMTALNSIERAIAASFDLNVTLNILLEQLLPRLNVDAASVLLLHPQLQKLEYAAGRGFRTRRIEQVQVALGDGLVGRALLDRRIMGVNDLKQSPAPLLRQPMFQVEEFVSYYVAPLIAKGEIKGVLEIFTRHPLIPDTEWIEFLESLSLQAATAIDNAQLLNGLQRTNLELAMAYDATIEGWAHALDLRDKETEGHTRRVADMTVDLARSMRFSEQDLIHVRRGALLHDIGKMAIPDRILHKNTTLNEEEWKEMRLHPVYAYQMLSAIIHLKESIDIPYCHHERWDGSGYPRGLKNDEIPLPARIFAVVDVWDALRSDRPYRPSWPADKTRDYLLSQRSVQFDPAILDAFIKLVDSKHN